MSIDFDRIRTDYPLPDIAAASGLKLQKNGNEFLGCCPFHSEKTESFTIYRTPTGVWKFHCFGCGGHGDSVDFVMERYGYAKTGEAARFITGEDNERQPLPASEYRQATNPYDGYDIGRPPETAPPIDPGKRTPPILNPKRVDAKTGRPKTVTYTPSMVFPYRNKNGGLIGYVLRVEFDGKKITPGVWWTVNKQARFEGWSHGSFPKPRPLYGLDRLHANPEHQVLLVEGEKCTDAAVRLMAGKRIVPVTWMGGGKSISKVHWKSLAGRSVVIWPDNDEEGWRTTMGWPNDDGSWHAGIVDYLFQAGAAKVKIVHITPASRPKGWDIADAEKEGLGQKGVELIIRDRIQDWPRERFDNWKAARIAERAPRGPDNDRADRERALEEVATRHAPHEAPSQSDMGDNVERRQQDAGAHTNGASHEADSPADPAPAATPSGGNGVAGPVQTGRGFQIDEETWRQHLIMKADGDGLKATSLQNFALLLQYERRFAGIFAWNDFAKEVFVMRRPPWDISGSHARWTPRKLTEPDVTATACWLEYCGMSPKPNDIGKVIVRVAEHNRFNPVTARLDELAQQWDGVPRLAGGSTEEGDTIEPWLATYMGAADNDENRAFGMKWMIGAVARSYEPGCKMDTMLILEGEQGLKKSTALRILSEAVAPDVFTDEISDPNSKDAGLQMQGALIVEISELDAFRRAEISQIKAWLTRQTDRFRRPYGKIVETFHRSCVFAGTVNPAGTGYLKDPTGGRRFWPVRVHEIDLAALRKDAPQLWAEAVVLYRKGVKWWLEGEEIAKAEEAQVKRYEEDPYGQMIDDWLAAGHTTITIMQIMEHLDIPKERRNSIVNRRIAAHLHQRGWRRATEAGLVYYVKPAAEKLL